MIVMVVAAPCALAAGFGLAAWRREPPLPYRCRRCGAEFVDKAWKRYPRRCPTCGARDWHVAP
jgi:hypothetical protein